MVFQGIVSAGDNINPEAADQVREQVLLRGATVPALHNEGRTSTTHKSLDKPDQDISDPTVHEQVSSCAGWILSVLRLIHRCPDHIAVDGALLDASSSECSLHRETRL